MGVDTAGHLSARRLRHVLAAATKRDAASVAVHRTSARGDVWSFLAAVICQVRRQGTDWLRMLRAGTQLTGEARPEGRRDEQLNNTWSVGGSKEIKYSYLELVARLAVVVLNAPNVIRAILHWLPKIDAQVYKAWVDLSATRDSQTSHFQAKSKLFTLPLCNIAACAESQERFKRKVAFVIVSLRSEAIFRPGLRMDLLCCIMSTCSCKL